MDNNHSALSLSLCLSPITCLSLSTTLSLLPIRGLCPPAELPQFHTLHLPTARASSFVLKYFVKFLLEALPPNWPWRCIMPDNEQPRRRQLCRRCRPAFRVALSLAPGCGLASPMPTQRVRRE